MRRWPVVAMAAALVVSACGTRLSKSERAARRAGVPGGTASAGVAETGALESDSAGAEVGAGATHRATTGPGARSMGSLNPAAGSASTGVPTAVSDPARSPGGGGARGVDPAGTSDPGVTDTEIRIGGSAPLSGIAGFLGEEGVGAVDSYFQTINAKGGQRPEAAADRLRRPGRHLADAGQRPAPLRARQGGGPGPRFRRPRDRLRHPQSHPHRGLGVTPKSFSSRYPTVFPMFGNALLWTQEEIVALKATGRFKPGMRVAMLYDTQILPMTAYVPFMKQSWENAGAKVVSTDPFNLSDGDCTSLVLKMRQLQVDWWDFQGFGWVLCASAAARQQYRPTMGWGGWPTSAAGLASQVGPWVEGMWGGSIGDQPDGKPRVKTAAHDEYVNAIRTYHPRLNTWGHLESPATVGSWVGAKLLVAALQAQGVVVTKAGINDWVAKVESFDPGITPPIGSMAPNCKTGSEVAWGGPWRWDAEKREAFRVPETGYVSSDQKEKFGGKCFLTKISDSFEK